MTTKLIMGMPITVEVIGSEQSEEQVFNYFREVDERFSTYKDTSEISRINRSEIKSEESSAEMREVFEIAEQTKQQTDGYFDIKRPDGSLDPSGVVKGWAIKNAAELLRAQSFEHFFIDAGGDIASRGKNSEGKDWSVGIRNPFKPSEIVKILYPRGAGVATSGSYIRGAHIYNPKNPTEVLDKIVSVTIVGPDVLEADLFATAAFAMGKHGIEFVENKAGFEGYAIDAGGVATYTSGFEKFTRL